MAIREVASSEMAMTRDAATRTRIDELQRLLDPRSAHVGALEELDEMFASGRAPDPGLSGFLRGRLLTTSMGSALDPVTRRVARMWMPWMGKSFDPDARSGVNVLIKSSRRSLKLVWPTYEFERETADALEVFRFQTRIAPGELDPELDVLKIDYDSDANPDFVIRRILDELVEVDEGFYLGKILFRRSGGFRRIGFFTLENA